MKCNVTFFLKGRVLFLIFFKEKTKQYYLIKRNINDNKMKMSSRTSSIHTNEGKNNLAILAKTWATELTLTLPLSMRE